MVRVRFAPSPTGSLHVGNALSAVINRRAGDWMLLRIDDTDPTRNIAGGEEAILDDLSWVGIAWDEGPVRQSTRQDRYREAAERIGTDRFDGITLLREDGTATYHLASVVDDADFGVTHVYRGNDHRANEDLHRRLHEALGTTPPEYVHHGLILGEDGKKLSKRAAGATVASLRDLAFRPPRCARTWRSWACRATTSITTSPGSGGSRWRPWRRSTTRSWRPSPKRRSKSSRRYAAPAT